MLNTIIMKYKIAKEESYPWHNAATTALHLLEGGAEYLKGASDFKDMISRLRILPSGHQIGDRVRVSFISENITCSIRKVIFDYSNVSYDVTLDIPSGTPSEPEAVYVARLYNVPSALISRKQ